MTCHASKFTKHSNLFDSHPSIAAHSLTALQGKELYARDYSSRRLYHSGTSSPAAPRPPGQLRLIRPAPPTPSDPPRQVARRRSSAPTSAPPIRPSPPPARIEKLRCASDRKPSHHRRAARCRHRPTTTSAAVAVVVAAAAPLPR